MINGVHLLLYTEEAEKLRETLRDVFGFSHVDAGGGWLIFALPPTEMGVHPGDAPSHYISMMCDDVHATMKELEAKGVVFDGEPHDEGYGVTVTMVLPGNLRMELYEPRHPTAI